jgi:hypothetical protein
MPAKIALESWQIYEKSGYPSKSSYLLFDTALQIFDQCRAGTTAMVATRDLILGSHVGEV